MSIAFHRVSVPISVPVSKKKRFYLNLNQYRNAHHFTLSKAKENFHEIVAPSVRKLPQFDTVSLVYTLFAGSEQLCDTANICSIVDKFFSDSMVTCKRIEDDNRKIVLGSVYLYGGIDRFDPRVEVTIIPGAISFGPEQKEEPMQIKIVQSEIEEAISDYVKKKLTVNAGQRIDIELMATRGDEGYTAIIDIVDDTAPPQAKTQASAPAPAPAPKATRPKAVTKAEIPAKETKAAAEPKAEPEVVAEQAPAEAVEEEASEAMAEEATVEPAEASPTKSLFEKVQETTAGTAGAATAEAESPATGSSEEQAPKTRPSLFGGMTAPSNS